MSKILRPFKPSPSKFILPVAFDVESKKYESEMQGFERPFLIGVHYGGTYKAFFDERTCDKRDPERFLKPGGCVHEFFRWLTTSPEGRALQSARGQNKRSKKPSAILYGHNAGGFDVLHLLRWLRRTENASGFDIKIVSSGSQLLELRLTEKIARKKTKTKKHHRPKSWIFRDSMRLVPGSLDAIGKKLLLETRKSKMDGGLDAPESAQAAWSEYNKNDCATVVSLVNVMHKQLDALGGHLKMTAPACAMDLFRRTYLPPFLKCEEVDGRANPLRDRSGIPRERHFPGCVGLCKWCRSDECHKRCKNFGQKRAPCPASPYGCLHAWLAISPTGARHGGRTEVFCHEENEGKLRYFDRNSSYAAAMTDDMPVKLWKSFGPGGNVGPETFEECEELGERFVGFVECIVRIPRDVNIPPLPVVHDGKLIFPVGRFYGRWDWTELRHLKEIGGSIEHVHRSVWYEKTPLLRPMMEKLFAIRAEAKKNGNEPLAEVCKLICNSLYGKFIQSPERDELFSALVGDEPEGAMPVAPEAMVRTPKGEPILWRRPRYSEADYFLPHIGSHITALAREALWLQMRAIEEAGGTMFYCDTDSVIFSGAEMESSSVLGAWKREYAEIDKLAGDFDSPKSYRMRSLGKAVFEKSHKKTCKDEACKGCAKELIHIKGLHRSKHTAENFELLRRGETVEVPDQPPKLGELLANDFKSYVTKNRKKSNLKWKDALSEDETVSKRVRRGIYTRPIEFDENTPTVYVDDGRAVKCEQKHVFAYYDKCAS